MFSGDSGSESTLTPSVLPQFIFVTTLVYNTPVSYRHHDFPDWAQGLGWLSALASLLLMPGYAIYLLARTPGSLRERLGATSRPAADWGPALDDHRAEWEQYKAKNPPRVLRPSDLRPAWLSRRRQQDCALEPALSPRV